MALPYDKQTWDTTSYVNPTRMNHIEQGIKDLSDNYNKVSQTIMGSSSEKYPVLLSKSGNDSAEIDTVRKGSALTLQPNNALLTLSRVHNNTNAVSNYFAIGNNIPSGTEGNVYGVLRLYGQGGYYAQIYDPNNLLTANRTYELPNKSGVLALTSDLTNTIPECDKTTDGTYTLQCVINNGVKTYSWV